MKIDKNLFKSFKLLLIVIGVLGILYISIFFYSLISGSLVYNIDSRTINGSITDNSFIADNETAQSLTQDRIIQGSLIIFDINGTIQGLDNFTIDYTEGTVLLN